jgi:hypothetical protein
VIAGVARIRVVLADMEAETHQPLPDSTAGLALQLVQPLDPA